MIAKNGMEKFTLKVVLTIPEQNNNEFSMNFDGSSIVSLSQLNPE